MLHIATHSTNRASYKPLSFPRCLAEDQCRFPGLDWQRCPLITDYFSKYPFLFQMYCTTTYPVIGHLIELFAFQGMALEVCTDNRQPFNSKKWHTLTNMYGFKHTTSSLHYPQSNDFIESMSHHESFFSKAKASRILMHQALMRMQQGPIDSNLPSPTEIIHTLHKRPHVTSQQGKAPKDI